MKEAEHHISRLLNEAKYLMKNYGDRGGLITPSEISIILDKKAEFNNCFIIHSKIIPSFPTHRRPKLIT